MPAAAQRQSVEWIPIIPYLAVLVLAVCGVHVTTVLVTGIVLTGAVGLLGGSVGWIEWIGALGEGIAGMGELIVITLLAGGMLEMIRRGGGIDYLIGALTRKVSGKRTAELSIAALVSMANLCTANNTIAIITTGPIARQIADRFGVDRRKSASLLDSFSCFVQGLIPYGAQLMIAAGLASVSPLEIIGYLYYPMALGIWLAAGHSAALSEKVFIRIARPYSRPTAIVPHAARHTRPGAVASQAFRPYGATCTKRVQAISP